MTSEPRKVHTDKAPAPGGHYSQAVVHEGLVFVSGQLPIVPDTGEKLTGSIETQTHQTLKNLEAILQAAGSDLDHVLKVSQAVIDGRCCEHVDRLALCNVE